MSIAEAWNQMREGQPIPPGEIHALVEQVRLELISAMFPDVPVPEENTSHTRHGVTVGAREEIEHPDGTRSRFVIEATYHSAIVEAAARAPSSPRVLIRAREWKDWTSDDGPQRAWVLKNLRDHVVTFLAGI